MTVKILIVGFQRSGTTLLRRLLNNHPEVKTILHEEFLLKNLTNKKQIIKKVGFDIDNFNWGEKVPYYPSARKIPIINYCNMWYELFGNNSRISHIIRHPYDVALSSLKTFNKEIEKSIDFYKNIVPYAFSEINKLPNVLTLKYENFLLNDNIVIPKIFSFCNIDSKIDYNKILSKSNKEIYRKLNRDRIFSYKKEKNIIKYNLENLLVLNSIDGPEYGDLT
jgi:hypothetical protein